MDFAEKLDKLVAAAIAAIEAAKNAAALDELATRFLGRKGELTGLLRSLAEAPVAERPKLGMMANDAKIAIERRLQSAKQSVAARESRGKFEAETEDVTEPGLRPPSGHLHLMNQAIDEITGVFERAGFTRVRYPEVEWDWYAFEALNMPKDHPARDDWETFFMDAPVSPKFGRMLLTPHGTSGTARLLADKKLPIRAINIQKTYRRQIDVTHTPMFHQFDGVFVDQGVSLAHLLGITDYFAREFFGPGRKTRLRPHHFRFTEPSFEVDISCGICNGTGVLPGGDKCRTCKRGWVELGGAGMLHPNVLKAAKIDPDKYSGLAFGWGVERTYLMKEGTGLDDLRTLYKNDLRFLQQF